MRGEGGSQKILLQFALRAGFHAHAVLFHDHVPLLIEFPEDGVEEALRFHQEPELNAIGWQAVVVLRRVERRSRIQSYSAILFDHAGVLVGFDKALRLVDGQLQFQV